MGINRYEHIPQYNPPILPYDLVMKAADMKQQRWDKAVGTAQDNFNDVFSKAKAISGSVDERVHLPAIREEFNNELSKLVSDPSMTAEQLSVRANGLVNRIQPRLNKYNDAYTLHTTALTEKMKNEGNATWSATNEYVSGPDTYNWDSEKNTDYSQLNYKSRTSLEPVIKPLIDDWEKTQLQTREVVGADGKTSTITVDGRDFAGLQNLGKTQALGLMTLPVFAQWQGDYKGIRPDDILKDTPGFVQTFGGKKFEELSNMDQAKAMIMFRGAKQLTMDSSKLAGPSGNPKGPGTTDDKYINNPWFQAEDSNNWAPSDIGLALGMENYDPTTNSYRNITAGNQFFNTPATISTFATPKDAATASIVQDLAQEPSIAGVLNILEKEIPTLDDSNIAKQAAALKGIDLYGDNGYTMKTSRAALQSLPENDPTKVAIRNYEQQKAALNQKVTEAFQSLKTSPRFLEAQSVALKAGINLNSPEDINKLVDNYKIIKQNLAKDQVANLGTAMIDLGGYDWTPQTGNNVINIEDKKFIKGFQYIPANYDMINQTLVPYLKKKGWDVAPSGYSLYPDILPDLGGANIDRVFNQMIAEGKMTKQTKGDKEYFVIPMNLEIPMKDPLVVNRYNIAKAGSDAIAKDQLPTWQREFADIRLQRNTAELANRLVEDPKTMTLFTNGINNFVLNTPSIDDGSRNMIVQALSKLTNDYVTHPNIETAKSIVNFQSTISQYAQKRYSKDNLTEYLNHISSNPYQPQGATTSNSMGIPRKR